MKRSIRFTDAEPGDRIREYACVRGPVAVFALHGGGIEPGTEQVARYLAENTDATVYIFSGRRGSANRKLRIPSYRSLRKGSRLLAEVLARVRVAISIHGHGRPTPDIYLGGSNDRLIERTHDLLEAHLPKYRVVSDPSSMERAYRANDSRNIVNVPRFGGVQLELPASLRQSMKTRGWHRHEHSKLFGETQVLADCLTCVVKTAYELTGQQD